MKMAALFGPICSPPRKEPACVPSYAGGTNWYSPTWNEVTHLFYFLSLDDCSIFKTETQEFEEGKTYYSTGAAHMPDENARKFLMAYDPVKNDFAWIQPQAGVGRSAGGVMSTASGIVAYGDDSEEFEVVDARTRRSAVPLQHGPTGTRLTDELCGQRQAVLCHRRGQRPLHLCTSGGKAMNRRDFLTARRYRCRLSYTVKGVGYGTDGPCRDEAPCFTGEACAYAFKQLLANRACEPRACEGRKPTDDRLQRQRAWPRTSLQRGGARRH